MCWIRVLHPIIFDDDPNARRDRLTAMIDERVRWLAHRDGPAPRVRPERARARMHRR